MSDTCAQRFSLNYYNPNVLNENSWNLTCFRSYFVSIFNQMNMQIDKSDSLSSKFSKHDIVTSSPINMIMRFREKSKRLQKILQQRNQNDNAIFAIEKVFGWNYIFSLEFNQFSCNHISIFRCAAITYCLWFCLLIECAFKVERVRKNVWGCTGHNVHPQWKHGYLFYVINYGFWPKSSCHSDRCNWTNIWVQFKCSVIFPFNWRRIECALHIVQQFLICGRTVLSFNFRCGISTAISMKKEIFVSLNSAYWFVRKLNR